MGRMASWWGRARRWMRGRKLHVWYSAEYRLPMPELESLIDLETRRADLAAWYMLDRGAVPRRQVHTPTRITWHEAGLAHTAEYLESLDRPGVLQRIMGLDSEELPTASLLGTLRLACGGTRDAAAFALAHQRPTFNLLGGFHHAEPDKGGGLCPLNDVAIAVASLRDRGLLRGRVVILDLDAHPPDGLDACFAGDPDVWIGSISGVDWGPLPHTHEILLGPGAGDGTYLQALRLLLSKAPPDPALVFVIAGGDVLAEDRLGGLALTFDGVQRRDLAVARAFEDVPTVWLPAGGYGAHAWRVMASTALCIVYDARHPIPEDATPMRARFARLASQLDPKTLEGTAHDDPDDWSDLDLGHGALRGAPTRRRTRLLDYYSEEGVAYALSRYGVFAYLRRLGYAELRVAFALDASGDRLQVYGSDASGEHLLIETLVERITLGDVHDVLYIHWLNLRNPRARFTAHRPKLPGQDAPGLGLAAESELLFERAAERLGLSGVAFRPSWFHTAYNARHRARFFDPDVQGRFEALLRDTQHMPLASVTAAIADERVTLGGAPYAWEPELMVSWRDPHARLSQDSARVAQVRDASRFKITPKPTPSAQS